MNIYEKLFKKGANIRNPNNYHSILLNILNTYLDKLKHHLEPELL